jgi:dTMP kinase
MSWRNQKPLFILFEGGEGSGKTTQAQFLFHKLKRIGRRVKYNDEPGSTDAGFKIRSILLEDSKDELDPLSEFLLFEGDRAIDFRINIIPALESGVDIIQDRNFGSTFAYQGYGRGLIKTQANLMKFVDKAARRGVFPDVIFLLDGDPKKLLRRIKKSTSFEKENLDFHNLVRKGFLAQARADKKHWVVLDALKPVAALHDQIWKRVKKLIDR